MGSKSKMSRGRRSKSFDPKMANPFGNSAEGKKAKKGMKKKSKTMGM